MEYVTVIASSDALAFALPNHLEAAGSRRSRSARSWKQ